MPKIFATVALPGAGKTTHALEQIAANGGTRANRDEVRFELFGKYWGKGVDERKVTERQDEIVAEALAAGLDVWIDDTNLSPVARAHCESLAAQHGVELEWVDFTEVPPFVCVERDSKRDRQVGPKVIWDMWEKYLKPEHPGDPNLPHAILVDVDGTLAIKGNRGPFEWHKVGIDTVNPMVAKAVELFSKEYTILIVSGRDGVCRPETEKWLADNNIVYDALYMRPEGDTRKDAVVKLEILEEIKKIFFPALCIDDRQQVVDAYRSVGLPVWQVARGDF